MHTHALKRPTALLRCTLMLVLGLTLGATRVQAGDEKPAPRTQTSLGLVIEVLAQPRQVDLPSAFSMAFRVQNATAGKVVLKEFRLTSVEAPTPLQVNDKCVDKTEQVAIEANAYTTIVCTVGAEGYADSLVGFFGAMLGRWSMLTLTPGEFQFVATASARGSDGNDEVVNLAASRSIPVRLVPTVWQAVLGSMLGSFLMVCFWAASPKVQEQVGMVTAGATGATGAQGALRTLGRALALWGGSTTAASIAIFLTFRMKDASLPFTLSVNDFYGGLVVGLFGVVLTQWLWPKLFGPPPTTRRPS